jgi:tRNA G10  N-methylase Trm11
MESLFILGRQPAIGRAELESVLGAEHLQVISNQAVACDLTPDQINFSRLGSSVKLARFLGTAKGKSLRELQDGLARLAVMRARDISEGKVQLGISAYGFKTSSKQLMAVGLTAKKALRSAGYSVRLVPNQEDELSSAQVLHNHLTGERGIELILVRGEHETFIGQTVAIQDITAYAKRDQERPKRDAFVGMLPPKLAQTIINLGVGQRAASPNVVVLDPFCGTGVVLQEALLMGFGAYGTDLEPRMIDYSRANLAWLSELHGTTVEPPLEVGDATSHRWKHQVDVVACEAYLGHPLGSWPKPDKLQQIISTCNTIIDKFMRNIGDQIAPGTRLCLAVPAWNSPTGKIYHLPLLDHLEKMGYNRVSFEHARAEELVYYRPDQLVARELLVITRK